jgi:hypothetical protein
MSDEPTGDMPVPCNPFCDDMMTRMNNSSNAQPASTSQSSHDSKQPPTSQETAERLKKQLATVDESGAKADGDIETNRESAQ